MAAPLVVLNPHASRLRNTERRAAILAAALEAAYRRGGVRAEVVDAGDLAMVRLAVQSAATAGAPFAVAIGGDGTIMEVLSAMADAPVPVAMVPAGTGNILAGTLRIPSDPLAALAALPDLSERTIDLGDAGWESDDDHPDTGAGPSPTSRRTFAVAAGMGFDARVMAATSPADKRRFGRAAYFVTAVKLAGSLRPMAHRITVDGDVHEVDAAVVMAIGCGEVIPGLLAPRLRVVPDDGLFEVIIVRGEGVLHGIRGAARLLLEREVAARAPRSSDTSIRMRAASVRIEPLEPQPIEIDGHPFEAARWLEATVRPRAARLLLPPLRR